MAASAKPRPNHHPIAPWLPIPAMTALEAEAVRRGLHRDVLAAQLLEVIARDDLYAALIDR